jgi:hypothetical protein
MAQKEALVKKIAKHQSQLFSRPNRFTKIGSLYNPRDAPDHSNRVGHVSSSTDAFVVRRCLHLSLWCQLDELSTLPRSGALTTLLVSFSKMVWVLPRSSLIA